MKEPLSDKIDESIGKENILKLWEGGYSKTLNSVSVSKSMRKLDSMIEATQKSESLQVKCSEVEDFIKELTLGKAKGASRNPQETHRYAPKLVIPYLTLYYNFAFCHSYVPEKMTDILLVPVVKDKLKHPSDSKNYRPVAIAPAASKKLKKKPGTTLRTRMHV